MLDYLSAAFDSQCVRQPRTCCAACCRVGLSRTVYLLLCAAQPGCGAASMRCFHCKPHSCLRTKPPCTVSLLQPCSSMPSCCLQPWLALSSMWLVVEFNSQPSHMYYVLDSRPASCMLGCAALLPCSKAACCDCWHGCSEAACQVSVTRQQHPVLGWRGFEHQ